MRTSNFTIFIATWTDCTTRNGKSNLEMRPMLHFTPKRIEAHICISFVAYMVYKALVYILRVMEIGMSVDMVLLIAKTITTLKIRLPNGELYENAIQYTLSVN